MDAEGTTSTWSVRAEGAERLGRIAPPPGVDARLLAGLDGQRKSVSATVVVGLMRVADLLLIALAALVVSPFIDREFPPSREYVTAVGLGLVVATVLFNVWHAYDQEYVFQRGLRTGRILAGWAGTVGILLCIAFALKTSEFYSRLWGFSWFVLTPALLILQRFAMSFLVVRWVRTARLADRTVIVGASEHGQRLASHLNRHGDIRTRVVGFVDDRHDRVPSYSHGHYVLGNVDRLVELIRENKVDQVFIALPWTAEKRVLQIIGQLSMTPVHIRLAPDLLGFEFTNRQFASVAGLPMLRVFDRPISDWAQVVKAAEDRIGALLLLILLSPAMALVALAIKLDSPGPVLFRQKRSGFNNELIEVFKFRSMFADQADADGAMQAQRGDPRVTGVGRILRALSLDELPQLLNVLRGEMSLVGPRPHAVGTRTGGRLFEDVVDRYAARHRVKPGMTGWAQVNGWRGETDTIEKLRNRVEHDLYYIDHWSFWFDVRILLRTVLAVLDQKNAY
jgi:Undecaprenyl-phosphate glucose phosphotransferase